VKSRTAFSNAIASMFDASQWICLLGLLVTVFIPLISPGAQGTDKKRTAAA
jgi:hypothetical protein